MSNASSTRKFARKGFIYSPATENGQREEKAATREE